MIPVGSTFYATYRDIRDALLSSKQRVSEEFLLEFLSSRGVLVCGALSREELIEVVAGLTHGYSDFEEIYKQLEVASRPERTTSRLINIKIEPVKLQAAVETIREVRKDYHEGINLIVGVAGNTKVKIEYTELDYGKTILRQRRARVAEIEVIKVKSQTRFRYPANDRIRGIVDLLVSILQKSQSKPIRQEAVDLSTFDKEQRTLYFEALIVSLSGFNFHDVIKVAVDSQIHSVTFADAGSEDSGDGEVDELIDDEAIESEELRAEVAEGMKSFLKNAALGGTGVMHSKELKQFLDSGFFISRVIWQAEQQAKNGYIVEIEAMLDDPSNGAGFRYSVKGYYPRKRNGSHARTRRPVPEREKNDVLNVIEDAAMKVFLEQSQAIAAKTEEKVK